MSVSSCNYKKVVVVVLAKPISYKIFIHYTYMAKNMELLRQISYNT